MDIRPRVRTGGPLGHDVHSMTFLKIYSKKKCHLRGLSRSFLLLLPLPFIAKLLLSRFSGMLLVITSLPRHSLIFGILMMITNFKRNLDRG